METFFVFLSFFLECLLAGCLDFIPSFYHTLPASYSHLRLHLDAPFYPEWAAFIKGMHFLPNILVCFCMILCCCLSSGHYLPTISAKMYSENIPWDWFISDAVRPKGEILCTEAVSHSLKPPIYYKWFSPIALTYLHSLIYLNRIYYTYIAN